MAEEKKEEVKKAEQPPEGDLSKELERVRGRHKVFKIVIILLASFFVLVLLAAGYIYHKMSGLRDLIAEAQDSARESVFSQPYAPAGQPPQSSYAGISYSTQNPTSSLMMLTGLPQPSPGGADALMGLPAANPRDVVALLAKYSGRPIVRDIMAELNKNPDFKKATENGDPRALVALLQNQKEMQKVLMKFAMRPDFFPFMKEVLSDPLVKPFLAGAPGGSQAAEVLRTMPAGIQVQAPGPGSAEPRLIDPRLQGTGGGAKVDPTEDGNPQQVSPAPIKTRTPPPMTE